MTKKDCFLIRLSNIFKYKKISLSITERFILTAIAAYADDNGNCSLSRDEIGSYIGINKTNVRRYLKKLKDKNILLIKKQFKKGKKCMTSNLYKINISAIIELSVDQNGKPFISRTGPAEVSFESNNDHEGSVTLTLGGRVNMTRGSCHSDTVKIRSENLKKDQKHKDIAHDTNLHRLNQPNKFDEFWAIYPRKQDKAKARTIWERKSLDFEYEKIMEDILVRAAKDVQWRNKEFIPYASSYLNGERWNDEIVEHNNVNKQSSTSGSIKDYAERLINIANKHNSGQNVYPLQNNLGRKVD